MKRERTKPQAHLDRGRGPRIGRRDVIKGGVSLAATGAVSPLFGSAARADTPKRGGTLIYATGAGSTSDSLDPTTYTDWNMYTTGSAVCNYLVELDENKVPHGELAESWEASKGATRWAFKLRKGIEFSNGKSLTAKDVVYSLSRHIGDDAKSPAKSLLTGIKEIRADGDHTVIVELNEGNADMPVIMTAYQLAIVPEGHNDWGNLIGTGGYVVEDFNPGVRSTFTRNSNYWKSDRAWVDRFEMLVVADTVARTSALLTGSAHVIDKADTKTVAKTEKIPGFTLIQNRGTRYHATAMNARIAPFDNVDFRLALKYGVDREDLLQKVNRGYAVLGNDHPVPPNDPFFNEALSQRTYDPDKAKFHLKKSGHQGTQIALSAAEAAYAGAVGAAELMQQHLKATGIDLTITREPNDGYWSNVWLKKPFCMVEWAVRPTPVMQFSLAFACGAPWADGFYCNDRFEALLTQAKVETEFAKRKDIIGEMQEILSNQGSNHILSFVSALDVYSNNVGGMKEDAAGSTMGTRLAERVWMVG